MKNKEYLVLDPTCGSRMIWFNKDNDLALFVDRRELEDEAIWTSGNGMATRKLSIKPDIIADFTCLPFEDNSFWHIVFDPPHLVKGGDNAWLVKKYGKLDPHTWEKVLHDGFNECMRVLKPNGTLVFKWNECQIPTRKVIKAIGSEPLYGNRSGKQGKTQWMVFMKTSKNNGEKITNDE